jgi:hypothetical protein
LKSLLEVVEPAFPLNVTSSRPGAHGEELCQGSKELLRGFACPQLTTPCRQLFTEPRKSVDAGALLEIHLILPSHPGTPSTVATLGGPLMENRELPRRGGLEPGRRPEDCGQPCNLII